MAEEPKNQKLPPTLSDETSDNQGRKLGCGFWLVLSLFMALLLGLIGLIAPPYFVVAHRVPLKSGCITNLKNIDGAVRQWALENKKQETDTVTTTDILAFLKGSVLPICSSGGRYSVSTVSAVPTCTKSSLGHSI